MGIVALTIYMNVFTDKYSFFNVVPLQKSGYGQVITSWLRIRDKLLEGWHISGVY